MRALASIGKLAITELTRSLGSNDRLVLMAAARTLGNIGADAKSAASELRRVARHSDRAVKREAEKALQKLD